MSEDLLKVIDLLKLRNCSKQTINNYISAIKRFKKHYEGEDIENFTETKILEYLKSNFVNKGGNASTINVNRAAIKYYYLVFLIKILKMLYFQLVKLYLNYLKFFPKTILLLY